MRVGSKKVKRGTLIKKCDRLFREIILKERGKCCQWCKKKKPVYVSHVLPKGIYPRLRYTRENVLLLCFHCHFFAWHKSPLDAHEFIEKEWGKEVLSQLKTLNRVLPKPTVFYLEFLIEEFKKEKNGKTSLD